MVYESLLTAIIFGIGKLVSSVMLAVGSIYIGLKAFDKLTAGIDELLEIKKGNVAVGVFFFSILIAIAILIRPGVSDFAAGIDPGYSLKLMAVLVTAASALNVTVVIVKLPLGQGDVALYTL